MGFPRRFGVAAFVLCVVVPTDLTLRSVDSPHTLVSVSTGTDRDPHAAGLAMILRIAVSPAFRSWAARSLREERSASSFLGRATNRRSTTGKTRVARDSLIRNL